MALIVELEKQCGRFHLSVSLNANAGEPLALLGASGSGKSMALKCIAGLIRPDEGYVELDGRILYDSAAGIDLAPQKRSVGYLFQQYALFPNMTVRENILAGTKKLPREARSSFAEEMIERFHLKGLENHYPAQLSGGQQQRTALARITASRPGAILLDEPFSALDSYLKLQMEEELHTFLEEYPGEVIWVSHDRGEAYRGCAKVCVMEEGSSSPVTDMKDLVLHPGTVSAARLAGYTNFMDWTRGDAKQSVLLPKWGLCLHTQQEIPDKPYMLGIRADTIRASERGEENAFECTVCKVIEDIGYDMVLLRPTAAEEQAPYLRMISGQREGKKFTAGEQAVVCIEGNDLAFLSEC